MKFARLPAPLLALIALAGVVSAALAAAPGSMALTLGGSSPAAPAAAPTPPPPASKGVFHFAWPAPVAGLREGGNISTWIQDTGTGDPHSGLFGCVRDDQHRFHEGLDIKCAERDRKNIPLDDVSAAMDGRVAYINSKPGNSSYGDYVVIDHLDADIPVYTLYAHLASIAPGLKVGQTVTAGTVLGRLGHSGTENVPLERSHLHFEIGLRMTNNFQPWYDSKKFGSPNEHGAYNGMNLIGLDPQPFFDLVRAKKFKNFADYFHSLPTAFTLRIATPRIPDFVTRYPALLTKPVPLTGVAGWDVAFTWYALPKQVTPLPAGTPGLDKPGLISLLNYDRSVFVPGCTCRETLIFTTGKDTPPRLGTYLNDTVKLMFGFK